ncbi:hypothetical protein [Sinorhizobium americanum]|uniref:Uncharacterized protein n=1 Tax=Sinorhizobium americanum TaxID=194963 RepID=A0A4V2REQ4_9HYPH|nr:hypothetical protein [Sinorhizobium americanum]TCN29580.1 hypothetical protein EV184_110244 [Sinorhizobium americanum]
MRFSYLLTFAIFVVTPVHGHDFQAGSVKNRSTGHKGDSADGHGSGLAASIGRFT